MPLVEKQYAKHSYHNQQHAADVVGKCGAMLRRDKPKLRRKLRVGKGKRAGGISQRQFGLFQLALILAAAIHDAGHPGECCCCCCYTRLCYRIQKGAAALHTAACIQRLKQNHTVPTIQCRLKAAAAGRFCFNVDVL
jgi:hypothetical protein